MRVGDMRAPKDNLEALTILLTKDLIQHSRDFVNNHLPENIDSRGAEEVFLALYNASINYISKTMHLLKHRMHEEFRDEFSEEVMKNIRECLSAHETYDD